MRLVKRKFLLIKNEVEIMNGRKAKAIRKMVYGEDMSCRFRKYTKNTLTGVITADKSRRFYKILKKKLGTTSSLAVGFLSKAARLSQAGRLDI